MRNTTSTNTRLAPDARSTYVTSGLGHLGPRDGYRTTNLPLPLTSLIGRDDAVALLHQRLASTRLVSVTGVGGCGKTRLAVHVAATVSHSFPDGAWFVDLSVVREPQLVAAAVAEALGLDDQAHNAPLRAVRTALEPRTTLLVLDSCEHVIDACAELVAEFLSSCPHLTMLITSREALGITGEVVVPLPPLAVPPPATASMPDEAHRYPAIQLFVERAHAVQPSFRLARETLPVVIEICRRLDGLPLAIELAAARVKTLAVDEIAARLDDRLRFLASSGRAGAARQQTLRATIAWSYDGLSAPDQVLFDRLSIFTGGWTLALAERIVASADLPAETVMEGVSRLVDKSLVTADLGEDGALRYRLLESLHHFARERLADRGETDAIRAQHASAFAAFVEDVAPRLRQPTSGVWLARLEAEHENLRAALAWAHDQRNMVLLLRLCAALGPFWWMRGHLAEGRRWLTAATTLDDEVDHDSDALVRRHRAATFLSLGVVLREHGEIDASRDALVEGIAISRALGDFDGVTDGGLQLGITALAARELDVAQPVLRQSLASYQQRGEAYGTTLARLHLAELAYGHHDDVTATALLDEELRSIDPTAPNRDAILWLAALLDIDGREFSRARDQLVESLMLLLNTGDRLRLHRVLDGLGLLAVAQGQWERALRLGGAASRVREIHGVPLWPYWAERLARVRASARQRLLPTDGDAAWAAGWQLTPEQALDEALEHESSAAPRPAARADTGGDPFMRLTRREREVLPLVIRGLSNREVAKALSIGERTVETHVTNLLGKLGLASRRQLTVWAAEQGLLAPPTASSTVKESPFQG